MSSQISQEAECLVSGARALLSALILLDAFYESIALALALVVFLCQWLLLTSYKED